jgi:hypothetical protein
MTLLGFSDQQKAPSDVITVTLDWSPFVPDGVTDLANRSVSTEGGDVTAENDASVTSGLTQNVKLSGGSPNTATIIKAHIDGPDDLDLTRAFFCLVR